NAQTLGKATGRSVAPTTQQGAPGVAGTYNEEHPAGGRVFTTGSVPNVANAPAPVLKEQVAQPYKTAVTPAYAPRFQRPQLIRPGSMSLLVPDVEHAIAQLTNLAQLQFGDVVSLDDQTPSAAGLRHTAEIQLSVPSDRFDETMTALAKLGAVQS